MSNQQVAYRGLKLLRNKGAKQTHMKGTLRPFANTDATFQKACELADVKPTVRQASKWMRGYGSAYAKRVEATEALKG